MAGLKKWTKTDGIRPVEAQPIIKKIGAFNYINKNTIMNRVNRDEFILVSHGLI